jgi:outer membrane protein
MRILILSSLLIFFSLVTPAQQELSLNQAIQIALHNNSGLKQSVNGISGYETNVMAAYGNFLPSLGLSGSWDWSKSDIKNAGFVLINGVPFSTSASSQNRSFSASVNSNWTLFDGLANIASLSQSKNDLGSAEASLERLKQDIVFQTISDFYNVINKQKLMSVKEEDLKWNQKNLETIRERNKLGAATLADVYQQEVAEGNAELQLVTAQNDFESSKNDLLYFLGHDVSEEYTFSDVLSNDEQAILSSNLLKDFDDLTELVNRAFDNRQDYKSAQLNLESSLNNVTIARSGHLPSLNANGFYSWQGDKLSEIDQSKRLAFGLTLSVPIFSGWSVTNRVQFAEVQAENKEIDLKDLERDIKRQIETIYLQLKVAKKGLDVSGRNVKSASENLKIEEEKYTIGASKLLDVLIANSNYTTAQTDLINSQYAYIVLSEKLKYTIGVLDYSKYE